jgi:hypothetical protein
MLVLVLVLVVLVVGVSRVLYCTGLVLYHPSTDHERTIKLSRAAPAREREREGKRGEDRLWLVGCQARMVLLQRSTRKACGGEQGIGQALYLMVGDGTANN